MSHELPVLAELLGTTVRSNGTLPDLGAPHASSLVQKRIRATGWRRQESRRRISISERVVGWKFPELSQPRAIAPDTMPTELNDVHTTEFESIITVTKKSRPMRSMETGWRVTPANSFSSWERSYI